jgi:hypothetical protein
MSKAMSTTPTGRYRHYKGNEYSVIGIARHSETLEELVVYRQEYGDHGLWVRPLAMFMEMVNLNGEDVPRFRLIEATKDEP